MALIPSSRYPAQIDAAAGYPQGRARNASTFQDGTGTPLERDWVNDIWGLLQSLLDAGGITASGDPDEVGASQYLDGLEYVADVRAERVMLDNWTAADAIARDLNAVAWSAASSVFVLVGSAGHISDSPRGSTWTSRASAVAVNLLGVAASPSEVVAVGAAGGVTRRATGGAFASQTSGTANQLHAIAWSGSLFAAVGVSGTVITSPTGVTWTTRTSGTAQTLRGITWHDGLFVAVGGTGAIITSPNGTTWTTRTSGTTETLRAITWHAGKFIAAGSADTIITSPDGITWTAHSIGNALNDFLAVGAAEGYALLLGQIDDAPAVWASSDGGTSWSVVDILSESEPFTGIAWNDRVAVLTTASGGSSGTPWKSLSRLPMS